MSDDNDNGDDYEVGYGKPPKNSRFGQPGGNPINKKGRPPGRTVFEFARLSEEALWQCFLDSAQKPVGVTEDGQEIMVPLIMALAKSMGKDAIRDPAARREYLKYVEKAVKGKDKLFIEMQMLLANYRERKLRAQKGSFDHYRVLYSWFMSKKDLRAIEGKSAWPYEDGEPITDADWRVFLGCYDFLKENPGEVTTWPPQYPSGAPDAELEG